MYVYGDGSHEGDITFILRSISRMHQVAQQMGSDWTMEGMREIENIYRSMRGIMCPEIQEQSDRRSRAIRDFIDRDETKEQRASREAFNELLDEAFSSGKRLNAPFTI